MKKLLITGYSGLLGNDFIHRYNKQYDIICLGRSKVNDYRYIEADLGSPDWSTDDLPSDIDAIIHLAQSNHFRSFPDHCMDVMNVNIVSSIKLIDYARTIGCNTFIFASSGGIYGKGNELFTEESFIGLQNVNFGYYLSTKLCSEVLLSNYQPYMDVKVLRFFFIYGAHQKQDMLIPRLVHRVINGEEIQLQGEDGISLNPIHVSDASHALHHAIELDGSHSFNIGGSQILSLRTIVDCIARIAKKVPNIQVDTAQVPQNIVGDTKKMTHTLYPPKVLFEEGVKDVIQRITSATCQ